jgi:hypothetical protein
MRRRRGARLLCNKLPMTALEALEEVRQRSRVHEIALSAPPAPHPDLPMPTVVALEGGRQR